MAGECDDYFVNEIGADDIGNSARTQNEVLCSMSSFDDFSSSRYKNNWDDLDELCTELTARDLLNKVDFRVEDTESAIDREFKFLSESDNFQETNCEEPVYEAIDRCAEECEIYNSNNNNCKNESLTVSPVHSDNIYVHTDADNTEVCEYLDRVTESQETVNASDVKSHSLVPPPRRKKLARLNKTKQSSAISDNICSTTPTVEINSSEVDYCAIQSDSGISEGTYNGLHVKTSSLSSSGDSADHTRESSETGSRISGSFGSKHGHAPHSTSVGASANQRKARKNKNSGKPNEKDRAYSHCDSAESLNGVNKRHKNRHDEKATSLTGFAVNHETTSTSGSDSLSLRADVHCEYKQIREPESAENSTDTDRGPYGSDSAGSSSLSQTPSANTPVGSRSTAEVISHGESELSPVTLQDIEEHGSDSPNQVIDPLSAHYEINEQESISYSGDDTANNSEDSRKNISIYVDSDDLQNVDGRLVVRPAASQLSLSAQANSDREATQSLRKPAPTRRHSAVVLPRTDATNSDEERGYYYVSPGRSKSVSDLSRDRTGDEFGHRRDSANTSVKKRVIGAVGKLSLRVRNVFKPKPAGTSEFYIEEYSEDSSMPRSKRHTNDAKCDRKHSSRLQAEVDGDYSAKCRPVSADQPSDVKTVHSCPEFNKPAKPKGKFSSLFGGKKWYTMGALPKLLKRKPKDKYSKSDKTSSASSQEFESVASAPVSGRKSKTAHMNGRHATNAKDKSAKEKMKRHDADSRHDLPTFISLEEYRRRMEDIENEELEKLDKRKRSRSMPYLDTSEEEEQGYTIRSEHSRTDRRRRPESYDEIRHRNERDTRRISEPVDNNEKRRRYKRRERNDRSSYQDPPYYDYDKSTMAVDYGFDVYHFKGHTSLPRPQSMSDLTYSDGHSSRYNNQPRNRNSVAAPEDAGRRRLLQPRDRNSIAVPTAHSHMHAQRVPERTRKDRPPRPKSMSALPQDDSLSSEEDPTATRRRQGNKKQKDPVENVRRVDNDHDIDPLEDAIMKHLKHENGPLARRKMERKSKQETGSMRRLKESFMAKKIWESVYDQLVKDLNPKGTKTQNNSNTKKVIESM